jgi:hypothetical protein
MYEENSPQFDKNKGDIVCASLRESLFSKAKSKLRRPHNHMPQRHHSSQEKFPHSSIIHYGLEFSIDALGQLEITSDNETITWMHNKQVTGI